MLPRGDQWGSKGAGSVAQCMVWDCGDVVKKPVTQPGCNDYRSRQGQRPKPRTTVKFERKPEDVATSRLGGELHAERVGLRPATPATPNSQHVYKRPPTPVQAWAASPTPRGDVEFGRDSINEERLVAAMKNCARYTASGTVLSHFYAAPRPPTASCVEQRPAGQGDRPDMVRFVRVKPTGPFRPNSAPPTVRRLSGTRNASAQTNYAVQRPQTDHQYRPPFRPAGGPHFSKWRPLTPPSTPVVRNWWRMSKFTKNAVPKISTFRDNETSWPIKMRKSGPRQVNFTMECPEESDMIVSIRLRTAGSQSEANAC